MQNTRVFYVDDRQYAIPEDEVADFKEYYPNASESIQYSVDGEDYSILPDEKERFLADMQAQGRSVSPIHMLTMDDGNRVTLRDEDVRQFVQARRTGQQMSRGMLKNTGIPDWYGKTLADREALADTLGKMFVPDDTYQEPAPRETNLGDVVKVGADVLKDAVGNLVFAPGSQWADWLANSDGMAANAVRGANDAANKFAGAIADIPAAVNDVSAELVGLGERLGGGDGELSRQMRANSAAARQAVATTLPTDTADVDPSLRGVNQFMTDTPVTMFKFAIPGMAPLAISADTANAFYDARENALANGASEEKADALATAKAGATAAMGLVLGKAAKGARGRSGFTGALTDMAITGGEMGALGGVNDLIDQGIEGADSPDWMRVLKTTGLESLKGAGFSAMSRAANTMAAANDRKIAQDERRAAQERAAEADRQIARDNARTRYEANLSEEARADIERNVNEMVKAEVIPSYRHAEEVARRAAEKLGTRDRGESAEAVQMAVMEAAQEVQAELQTPSRVTSPALERRQTEAKMRENEYWSKRSDELVKKYGEEEAAKRLEEEKAADKRNKADADAQNVEHQKRIEDAKAAFSEDDAKIAEEYERSEAERKSREEAEQNAPEPVETKPAPVEGEAMDLRDSPEYKEWLRKSGRNDTDKNWNKYVMENELDPALKVERGHDGDAESNWRRGDVKDEVAGAIEDIRNRIVERDAQEAERKAKQEDLEAAFADWKDTSMKKTAAQKKGSPVKAEKQTENPADFADFCKGDPQLQALDKEYRAATKAIDKGDVEYRVRERLGELRDEWAKRDAKPTEPPRTGELARPQSTEPTAAYSAKEAEPTQAPVATKPKSADNPVSEMTKADVNSKFKEPLGKANDLLKGDDAEAAESAAKALERATAGEIATAIKLIKEKFYQSASDLTRQLKALPAQAPARLRAAYETAIAEAKRRNAETRQISEETVAMRANDPKRRGRAEVLAWAKSKGRQIVNGMVTPDGMREYDAQMSNEAAKVIKRLFTDMDIVSYDKAPELGGDGKRIEMRNKHGNTLGWFEPTSKRVVLLPGADAETVAHEIGWHAVRDWAKRNNPKLFDKMREVEDNVDPTLRAKVLHIYRSETGYTRDMLLNEFGAFSFMGRGGKELEKIVATRDGAKWYAKMLNAAKDVYKDFVTKHGGNRVDIENIDAMDGEEFMNHMAKEIASGKSFGEIGAPKPATKPLSTKESFTEKQKRIHYDIGSVFRSIGKDIEKNGGGKKNAATEVDEAFGLKPGEQEAASIRVKSKSNELKELYAKHGISHEDFSYYMACKAAAGRDAKIDARNIKELQAEAVAKLRSEWGSERISADPEGFKAASDAAKADAELAYKSSNGSNISPSEAAKTIREWESGDMSAKTADLRNAWREIIDNTLQMQKEAGLISEKQYNEWKSQEKDYVPFKSPIDEETGEYVGRGATNFLRPEHMTAKGRKTAAGDVLSHAMVDWQATENRVIENRLREKLANLVEANPELGTVEKVGRNEVTEKKTRDDFKDGKIVRDDGGDPNVVLFKRNGDTYAIRMNGTRGAAMAAAITGRNLTGAWANKGVTMPKWLGGKKITFRSATRAWAATATSLSPTFAIRNTIKDNIELANIVFTEMGPVKGSKFAANYVKNRETNHLAIMKFIATGKIDASTPSGKALQDFINDGGMIGGMSREGYADFAKQFSADDIGKMMKSGHNRAAAVGKHVLNSVSYLTEWSELATRVNAYAAAKSVGMSGKEAALWSRRAVTDFNRHGEWTGTTNVLRMFSNSTLGATARAAKSFTTSKWGIMSAAALLAKGYLGAMLEEAMNDESDERAKKTGEASTMDVSEFDRQNSALLIRNGDKEYRVPAHESFFSMLSYAGNCLRRVQTGKMTSKQMAKELGLQSATMMANLSGLGSVNLDSQDSSAMGMFKAGVSSAVPSLLQPIVEILTNTDYAGRQVYREQYPAETSPRAERGRKNTPEFYKEIARKLNEYTGGNKARSGFADFNPEIVQKMVEGAGKNVMKDAVTAYMTISAALNGEFPNLDVKNTVVARDFKRTVSDSTPRFFNAQRETKKDIDEWTKLKGEMTRDERIAYLADHPWCRESVQERLRLLVNGSKKSGVLGINSLRHLVDGKTADGKERKKPATDEQIEYWREHLRRRQAKYIELTTKK